jgi:hypothetical protein
MTYPPHTLSSLLHSPLPPPLPLQGESSFETQNQKNHYFRSVVIGAVAVGIDLDIDIPWFSLVLVVPLGSRPSIPRDQEMNDGQ